MKCAKVVWKHMVARGVGVLNVERLVNDIGKAHALQGAWLL